MAISAVALEVADEVWDAAGEPAGFGSVRVHARIGETAWATSVFPEKVTGSYLLPTCCRSRGRCVTGRGSTTGTR